MQSTYKKPTLTKREDLSVVTACAVVSPLANGGAPNNGQADPDV